MEKLGSLVERRAFKRIPGSLEVRFFYGNMFYCGAVIDLSESGMHIRTRTFLPFKSRFAIIIDIGEKLINVFARVKRITKTNGCRDGIGVEILNDPQDYLEFIKSIKYVL